MGFTTPAFIRKNTPELRMKLERLGYYLHPECIDDDRGNYLFVNREYYLNYGYDICKADNGTFIAAGIFDGPNDGGQWDTYEEALEVGIQKALKLV